MKAVLIYHTGQRHNEIRNVNCLLCRRAREKDYFSNAFILNWSTNDSHRLYATAFAHLFRSYPIFLPQSSILLPFTHTFSNFLEEMAVYFTQ